MSNLINGKVPPSVPEGREIPAQGPQIALGPSITKGSVLATAAASNVMPPPAASDPTTLPNTAANPTLVKQSATVLGKRKRMKMEYVPLSRTVESAGGWDFKRAREEVDAALAKRPQRTVFDLGERISRKNARASSNLS